MAPIHAIVSNYCMATGARRRLGRHLRPADPVRLRRVLAALARAQVFVPQISREGYSAHPFVPRDIAKSWLDRSAFDQTIKKHLAKLVDLQECKVLVPPRERMDDVSAQMIVEVILRSAPCGQSPLSTKILITWWCLAHPFNLALGDVLKSAACKDASSS